MKKAMKVLALIGGIYGIVKVVVSIAGCLMIGSVIEGATLLNMVMSLSMTSGPHYFYFISLAVGYLFLIIGNSFYPSLFISVWYIASIFILNDKKAVHIINLILGILSIILIGFPLLGIFMVITSILGLIANKREKRTSNIEN